MKYLIAIAVILPLSFTTVVAQEIECDVRVDSSSLTKLTTEARENISGFLPQLIKYINDTRWTREGLGGEKVKCAITISFLGSPRDNHYAAQAVIGSKRLIFQSERNTAMLRILDDKWEFDYTRGQAMEHNDLRFDPLLSFIDYYVNLILGYDFESYKTGDGTPFFQKDLDIANKARGYGGAGPGWDIPIQNTYTRGLFIDELTNSKFYDFREAMYRYHYKGVDLLAKDDQRARKNIFAALEKIGKLKERVNPNSLIIRTFFDTKSKEIAEILAQDRDNTMMLNRMSVIDQSHKQDYDKALGK